MGDRQAVHVVAAALEDDAGQVLVTRRPDGKQLAGRWEFPGGKVEEGESPLFALRRELLEELNIEPLHSEPLIKLQHEYPDFTVELDVHRVTAWQGSIRAMENQEMQWCLPDDLHAVDILEADLPVIHALRLPARIIITPECLGERDWWPELHATLAAWQETGFMLQLRQPQMHQDEYRALADKVLPVAKEHGVAVMLNGSASLLQEFPEAAGIHVPGKYLKTCSDGQPIMADAVSAGKWFSTAVHDRDQLELALLHHADFLLVSPISRTRTHPKAEPLGWQGFHELASAAEIPCYALGGIQPDDLESARQFGGQGIAGISSFWKYRS